MLMLPKEGKALSPSRRCTISHQKCLAFHVVLTVSKTPAASASVSASGSVKENTGESERASDSRGGAEGSKGDPRGVEAQKLARPTVRIGPLGLRWVQGHQSVYPSGVTNHLVSTLSDQPQTDAG